MCCRDVNTEEIRSTTLIELIQFRSKHAKRWFRSCIPSNMRHESTFQWAVLCMQSCYLWSIVTSSDLMMKSRLNRRYRINSTKTPSFQHLSSLFTQKRLVHLQKRACIQDISSVLLQLLISSQNRNYWAHSLLIRPLNPTECSYLELLLLNSYVCSQVSNRWKDILSKLENV